MYFISIAKKLSNGFIRNGHDVVNLSDRDTIKFNRYISAKSGIDYWINAPLIRTSSQKYDYMNYIQLIGKGVIADLSAGYVTYNLYKIL